MCTTVPVIPLMNDTHNLALQFLTWYFLEYIYIFPLHCFDFCYALVC